jgi:tetratricopeptide (TPR) repeat protein
MFVAVLLVFLAAGLGSRWFKSVRPRGLPDDPAVRAAQALLKDVPPATSGPLRFRCELVGAGAEEPPGARSRRELGAAEAARVAMAEQWLLAARRRQPRDIRLRCAVAHLDLAAQRFERAEREYRETLDRAPRYGEARLGLGVTLALAAATGGDRSRARRLRLEAIAQLAAVEADDPSYLPALYDRALLLRQVGRREEAVLWARRYLARDPTGRWAETLVRELGLGKAGPA